MVLQVRGPGNEREAIYAFNALIEDYPTDCLHTGREIAPDDIDKVSQDLCGDDGHR